jgi:hypothetical protein
MKKLLVFACALLLGASLSFAEVSPAPTPAIAGTTVAAKGKKHHRHHHHHKGGKNSSAATQPPK